MAKRHGLSTDASFRFERGVDPEIIEAALARATALITEWAGGGHGHDEATAGELPAGQTVTLEWAQLYQLIGIVLEKETVHAILKDLDIAVVSDDGTAFGERPAYRHDAQPARQGGRNPAHLRFR